MQGPHMAYSSASCQVIAFCYCCRIARTVTLFPARPSLLLGKYVVGICVSTVSVTVPGGWLPLTGLSWIPYASARFDSWPHHPF